MADKEVQKICDTCGLNFSCIQRYNVLGCRILKSRYGDWLVSELFDIYEKGRRGMFIEEVRKGIPQEEVVNLCKGCENYMACKKPYNRECNNLLPIIAGILQREHGKDWEIEGKQKREDKVIEFPVNMDRLQKDILTGLLFARKECAEENVLTVSGVVSILDALFYLVKEGK